MVTNIHSIGGIKKDANGNWKSYSRKATKEEVRQIINSVFNRK